MAVNRLACGLAMMARMVCAKSDEVRSNGMAHCGKAPSTPRWRVMNPPRIATRTTPASTSSCDTPRLETRYLDSMRVNKEISWYKVPESAVFFGHSKSAVAFSLEALSYPVSVWSWFIRLHSSLYLVLSYLDLPFLDRGVCPRAVDSVSEPNNAVDPFFVSIGLFHSPARLLQTPCE